jgi:3-methyladenine DNA glycosylase AlkC
LELLCTDPDAEVRLAVAACRRATFAALSQLGEDENFQIRALAREALAKKAPAKKSASRKKQSP